MTIIQTLIDQSDLVEAQKTGQEIRYKVILNTSVQGGSLAWVTRVTASSPQEAVERARQIFRKQRGHFQEAVLQEWKVGTITPIATRKPPQTPKKSRRSK